MPNYKVLKEKLNSSNELIVIVENNDRTLSKTGNNSLDIKYGHPPGESAESTESFHGVQVFVITGDFNESNPNPLVFETTMRKLVKGGSLAWMYCMTLEGGITKEKERRKTNVTVSSGGGITVGE